MIGSVVRSRKLQTLAAVFAVATGAFLALTLNAPTTIVGSGTSAAFSPSAIEIPADLSTLSGADAI